MWQFLFTLALVQFSLSAYLFVNTINTLFTGSAEEAALSAFLTAACLVLGSLLWKMK